MYPPRIMLQIPQRPAHLAFKINIGRALVPGDRRRRVSGDLHREGYYENDFIYRLDVASEFDVLILRERAPRGSERSSILTFCAARGKKPRLGEVCERVVV